MPCISGNYNPAVGPLIRVAIVDAKTAFGAPADTQLNLDLKLYNALIDTGATSTCISDKVIAETGLVPTGKTMMSGATGKSPTDQFTFGVGFLLAPQPQPSGETSAGLVVRTVQGCLFHNKDFVFDVLLGRDVICAGAFTLTFDGHFTLSL